MDIFRVSKENPPEPEIGVVGCDFCFEPIEHLDGLVASEERAPVEFDGMIVLSPQTRIRVSICSGCVREAVATLFGLTAASKIQNYPVLPEPEHMGMLQRINS